VIVAGHAVLRRFADPSASENWVLLPFQRSECTCYVEHVRRGVEEAAGRGAVLVFSGGQSRAEAGRRSEAESYLWIAEHHDWFGRRAVAGRTVTEEFARDSFENLLFGICRFREYAGVWPEAVTLVSWGFKEARFHLHREALGWPVERFAYSAPNDPPDLEQALQAERRAVAAYTADPYSASEAFRKKREERNPFRRQHGYAVSCPEVAELLAHGGPERFAGALPWRP
jgi:hypothetical protein